MRSLSVFLVLFVFTRLSAYRYEVLKEEGHCLHVFTINPKDYTIKLVKASGSALGRETVPLMARRAQAAIAINGGFFKRGYPQDGKPSGTLVVDGKVYAWNPKEAAVLHLAGNTLTIGPSVPGDKSASAVSGIPQLIKKGQILDVSKKGNFYQNPHARTALGIKADGDLVVLVAEQPSKDGFMAKAKQVFKTFFKGTQSSTPQPKGLTIPQLAQKMQSLGCVDAINLDGGGSSTLYVQGNTVYPKNLRPVSNALVFVKR